MFVSAALRNVRQHMRHWLLIIREKPQMPVVWDFTSLRFYNISDVSFEAQTRPLSTSFAFSYTPLIDPARIDIILDGINSFCGSRKRLFAE